MAGHRRASGHRSRSSDGSVGRSSEHVPSAPVDARSDEQAPCLYRVRGRWHDAGIVMRSPPPPRRPSFASEHPWITTFAVLIALGGIWGILFPKHDPPRTAGPAATPDVSYTRAGTPIDLDGCIVNGFGNE